jgi:peptide/nickel transport system substrate-binding protein
MRKRRMIARTLALFSAALIAASPALAQPTPKRGGTLTFAVGAEPPSYDCHANSSFGAIHWLAPHYSLLV